MKSLYTFTDYSPEWPLLFDAEKARLQTILGSEILEIHHIGSTSVPGLAAKPIIDLLPVVEDLDRLDKRTPRLQEAGYKAWGEYGLPGRRFFTKDHNGYRTHNIHMYQVEDPDIERHLAFCTFLRNHDQFREEYAALKREVYKSHPDDIAAYGDGKNAWIKRVEQLALSWYRQQQL